MICDMIAQSMSEFTLPVNAVTFTWCTSSCFGYLFEGKSLSVVGKDHSNIIISTKNLGIGYQRKKEITLIQHKINIEIYQGDFVLF